MKVSGWRRAVYGVWAIVEVLLFGGLIYGWPSLVFLLKQRHVYSNMCPRDVNRQIRHNSTTNPNSTLATSMMTMPNDVSTTNAVTLWTQSVWMDVKSGANTTSLVSWNKDESGGEMIEGKGGYNSSLVSSGLDQTGNCDEQDAAFGLAFTIITTLVSVGSVAFGHAQRYLGMRATRIISWIMYAAGVFMVGFVTPDRPVLLTTGMGCVAVAGLVLLVTNVQLGAMFGKGQTTYVGVLSGAYDVSAVMQLVIKLIITSGADYLFTYIGVAVLSCMTLVSALLWFPNGPVFTVNTPDIEIDIVLQDEDEPNQPKEEKTVTDTSYVTSRSLLSSMTSPLFVLHTLWMASLQLRLFFFVGVLNRWLIDLTGGDLQEVDRFTSVQLYTGCASVVFAVLAGCLYDLQRHRHKDSTSRERRHLGGAVLPLFLGCALCCVLSVLVLIPERHVLYLTFLVFAAFRSVMYSLAVAFIAITFPGELFGVLYGTMMIVGGIVACLQYPLFIWAETSTSAIRQVNILLLCMSALTFLHPLHVLWKCRRPPPSPSATHTTNGDMAETDKMMLS